MIFSAKEVPANKNRRDEAADCKGYIFSLP